MDGADAATGPRGPALENQRLADKGLGDDQRVTNTGGGNTSSKIMEKDPLTGQPVEVLWVKGSGGDLRWLQELLGRASLSTTQVYAGVDSARLISAWASAHPRA